MCIVLNGKRLMAFPLRNRQGCPLTTLINAVLEVLDRGQEKEIKDIRSGKEKVKLSLFEDDMMLYIYIENHKDSTKEVLALINELRQVVEYKINI